MKKYIAPELETAKFTVNNVIAVSGDYTNIIGGDNVDPNQTNGTFNGVVEFDWDSANWN